MAGREAGELKLPAIQFYPGDWRKDPGVQALDYESRGVWLEMLLIMHECPIRGKLVLDVKPHLDGSPGDLQPISERCLADLVKMDVRKLRTIIAKMEALGVFSRDENGAICSRRMLRDEKLRRVRANCGKLGGRPTNNQTESKTKPNRKQNLTPSVSSSSSASSSTTEQQPSSPAATEAGFAEFYSAYPKKRSKGDAEKAWKSIKPDSVLTKRIVDAVVAQSKSPGWRKDDGQFIPYPATWLRDKGWEDVVEVSHGANGKIPPRFPIPPAGRIAAINEAIARAVAEKKPVLAAKLGRISRGEEEDT